MSGLSYTEALFALVLISALLWAPLFGLAYRRRKFGGSARNYLITFVATWMATIVFFVALTAWENVR